MGKKRETKKNEEILETFFKLQNHSFIFEKMTFLTGVHNYDTISGCHYKIDCIFFSKDKSERGDEPSAVKKLEKDFESGSEEGKF